MTTITQVREDAMQFDLVINDEMPEMFTDGISQALMGVPITKLTFHSVTKAFGSDNAVEQRTGVLRLVIPTPVLLEMCRNILLGAQTSLDAFADAGKQIDLRVRTLMSGVSIAKLPANETATPPAKKRLNTLPKSKAKPKPLPKTISKTKK